MYRDLMRIARSCNLNYIPIASKCPSVVPVQYDRCIVDLDDCMKVTSTSSVWRYDRRIINVNVGHDEFSVHGTHPI